MNCPNCNKSDVEQAKGFYNGEPLKGVLANFCGGCGYDLRPYHDGLKKKKLIIQTVVEDFKAKGPIRDALIETILLAIDANHGGLRQRLRDL